VSRKVDSRKSGNGDCKDYADWIKCCIMRQELDNGDDGGRQGVIVLLGGYEKLWSVLRRCTYLEKQRNKIKGVTG